MWYRLSQVAREEDPDQGVIDVPENASAHPEGEGDIPPPGDAPPQTAPLPPLSPVREDLEPEQPPSPPDPEPVIDGVIDFIDPNDDRQQSESMSEDRAYDFEDLLRSAGAQWPAHDNCRCQIKQMPSGKPMWEASPNACQTCVDYQRAFNAESTKVFG